MRNIFIAKENKRNELHEKFIKLHNGNKEYPLLPISNTLKNKLYDGIIVNKKNIRITNIDTTLRGFDLEVCKRIFQFIKQKMDDKMSFKSYIDTCYYYVYIVNKFGNNTNTNTDDIYYLYIIVALYYASIIQGSVSEKIATIKKMLSINTISDKTIQNMISQVDGELSNTHIVTIYDFVKNYTDTYAKNIFNETDHKNQYIQNLMSNFEILEIYTPIDIPTISEEIKKYNNRKNMYQVIIDNINNNNGAISDMHYKLLAYLYDTTENEIKNTNINQRLKIAENLQSQIVEIDNKINSYQIDYANVKIYNSVIKKLNKFMVTVMNDFTVSENIIDDKYTNPQEYVIKKYNEDYNQIVNDTTNTTYINTNNELPFAEENIINDLSNMNLENNTSGKKRVNDDIATNIDKKQNIGGNKKKTKSKQRQRHRQKQKQRKTRKHNKNKSL